MTNQMSPIQYTKKNKKNVLNQLDLRTTNRNNKQNNTFLKQTDVYKLI